jgi:hypothetical protein
VFLKFYSVLYSEVGICIQKTEKVTNQPTLLCNLLITLITLMISTDNIVIKYCYPLKIQGYQMITWCHQLMAWCCELITWFYPLLGWCHHLITPCDNIELSADIIVLSAVIHGRCLLSFLRC